MKNSGVKLSVIIPCLNGAKFIDTQLKYANVVKYQGLCLSPKT